MRTRNDATRQCAGLCGKTLKQMTNKIPTANLTTIVRQAGALKRNSLRILDGVVPSEPPPGSPGAGEWHVWTKGARGGDVDKFRESVLYLYRNVLADKLGYDLLQNVQLLTARHDGPLGTKIFNVELQKIIHKKLYGIDVPDIPAKPKGKRPELLIHDRVMQMKNDYNIGANGIMNGTVGFVVNTDMFYVDDKGKRHAAIGINFDGEDILYPKSKLSNLSLAYACSVHKFQGSEVDCAVVIMHKQHAFMQHRNLFYTAVTRAKSRVIICGDNWGMAAAARRVESGNRVTFLSLNGAGN